MTGRDRRNAHVSAINYRIIDETELGKRSESSGGCTLSIQITWRFVSEPTARNLPYIERRWRLWRHREYRHLR
jgi:hypothetical protein